MISYLLVFLFFLVLSAFFSSAETALTGINRDKIDYLSKKGKKKAKLLKELISKPSEFLSTILIGNTLVNAALASISTAMFSKFFKGESSSLIYSTIVVTVLILIFSEATPKSIAAVYSEKIAFSYVYLIKFFKILFSPFVLVLNWITMIFLKRVKLEEEKGPHIDEETLALWLKSHKIDIPSERRKELYHRFFSFFQKRVKDVMVPRYKTIAIEIHTSLSEILEIIEKNRFSRYPVYEKRLDNIKGILLAKDLMSAYLRKRNVKISDILKKPLYLPESVFIEFAFNKMRMNKTHIAIVVDEFESFEGIITMEDIIEELTGAIDDEKDEEKAKNIIKTENGWEIDGETPIRDLEMEIPDLKLSYDEDFSTLSGFILDRLGKIPKQGDGFEFDGFYIKILDVKDNKILKVSVEKINEDSFNK